VKFFVALKIEKEFEMPKFVDFRSCPEAQNILESLLKRFGEVFEGFNPDMVDCWLTSVEKKSNVPVKVHPVRYPMSIYIEKPFVIEIFDVYWAKMDKKRKNIVMFHAMCSVSEGGFDEQSKEWGKTRKPDIKMFTEEFAVTGGVPNWIENEDARDPLVVESPPISRVPVSQDAIENAGLEEEMMGLVQPEQSVVEPMSA